MGRGKSSRDVHPGTQDRVLENCGCGCNVCTLAQPFEMRSIPTCFAQCHSPLPAEGGVRGGSRGPNLFQHFEVYIRYYV